MRLVTDEFLPPNQSLGRDGIHGLSSFPVRSLDNLDLSQARDNGPQVSVRFFQSH